MQTPVVVQPDLSSRPFAASASRQMAAAPPVIFRAWTEQLDRWFAMPGTLLMRPGVNAPYFFETHHAGERHPHYGRILRLVDNHIVEMTWLNAGGTNGYETVLTVTLAPAGTGTMLRVHHAGFPNADLAERHRQAWPVVLEMLDGIYQPAGSADGAQDAAAAG
jgi:uncharacterized protein YndB with AHSA1/START domain